MAKLERNDITPVSPFDGVDESRLIETLRIQHENEQTGNPSFSWEQLTRVSAYRLYALGSEGRFYHPEFGLIRAVYVKFLSVIDNETIGGCPVGLFTKRAGFEFAVTHLIQDSSPKLLMGFAGPYDDVNPGDYGWVIVEGINLQTLKFAGAVGPKKLDKLTWSGNGILGDPVEFAGGYIFDESGVDSSGPGQFEIAPGAFRVDLGVVSSAETFEAFNERLLDIESKLPALISRNDVISIKNELGQSLSAVDRTAQILTTQFAEINDSQIIAEMTRLVAVSANYANVTGVEAANAMNANHTSFLNLQAAVQNKETARIYRDEARVIAEASQVSYLNAQAASNLASANASIIASQVVIAEAAAAAATNSVSLLSQFSIAAINPNPYFHDYAGDPYPDAWVTVTGGAFSVPTSNFTLTKGVGFYAANVPVFTATAANATGGIKQVKTGGLASVGRGAYVLEFDCEQVTAFGLRGLHAEVYFLNASNTVVASGGLSDVWGTAPSGGTAPSANPGLTNANYRYRVFIQTANDTIRSAAILIFYSTTGSGQTPPAGAQCKIHRIALRKAGSAEMDSQLAIDIAIAAQADVLLEETARSDADDALASTLTSLSATVIGVSDDLTALTTSVSTIDSSLTVQSGINSTQAISITTLQSDYTSLDSRVDIAEGSITSLTTTSAGHTTQLTTQAGINSAQATSITSLEANYTSIDTRVDAAEATLTTVNTTVASHTATLSTQATAISGQATSITNLTARMTSAENGLTATNVTVAGHTTSINALVTSTSATASQVTTLTSQVGDHSAIISDTTLAVDGILAKRTLEINVNGAITGTELIGGGGRSDFIIRADNFKMFTSTGNRQIFSVNADKIQLGTDLFLGGFKIIMDNGTAMFVLGTGFGAANNFILWYGPSGNPATVTTSGALFYLTTARTGYFGGNLNPGVLYTARQTTDLATNASIQIGPFGTDGNDRIYNIGATYVMRYRCNFGTGALTGTTNIQVTIQRLDGASWTTLGILNLNEIERTVRVDGEPGIPDRVDYVAGGSIQITDNTHSTGTVTLRAVMTTRVTPNFIGAGFAQEVNTQTITISSTEQPIGS